MKKNLLLAVILVIGLISCKKQENNGEETQVSTEFVNEHTAQNSLDWNGTYEGTLPCADCEGIKTTIVLNPDETFYAKREYLGGDDSGVYEIYGNFSWDKTGTIITIEGDERFRRSYKVVENAIIHLDNEGNEITGELAEFYRLAKK